MERLLAELIFHDEQARERASYFRLHADELRFDDAAYLDHETWIRPAFAQLGPLQGKRVLDYGCGHGMASVVMARAGAIVNAFDLSPRYVKEAELRARANRVNAIFRTADAEHLPYADESFDAIWGNAILHHLLLDQAAKELKRVLKPGGVAVFCEPWGGNPFLNFARRFLPYPGKDRTIDEMPLNRHTLKMLAPHFPQMRTEGFQLFGMIRRITKFRPITAVAQLADRITLGVCPPLKNWCRYLVIALPRG
jgi:2-polyprenyl-3-methyl-5-hydroxy-6-metoxy-1,4-benzoquinol methylase